MMKLMRISWITLVVCMMEMRNFTKFWSENQKGRDHLEDLDVDGMVILKLAFKSQGCDIGVD
jgi:hypothetical protein